MDFGKLFFIFHFCNTILAYSAVVKSDETIVDLIPVGRNSLAPVMVTTKKAETNILANTIMVIKA